ncbi:MAG TPA: 1,4-alpha-glucan branching protein GlgB [Acidimicrobiales bacterium]|jgi:1,4-alpha-glucan branching enzyme|nr:1,4-alpha-glucan branching protein GlgB [Acidimicrobiales bacterium]
MTLTLRRDELQALVANEHPDPHRVLGPHGTTVRALCPDAEAMAVVPAGGAAVAMTRLHEAGVFEAEVGVLAGADAGGDAASPYRLEARFPSGAVERYEDPYRFWPTLGEVDLHLLGEGRHHRLWQVLGAHHRCHQGVWGTAFAVWAPSARSVRVVGEWNRWDGRRHRLRCLGSSGVWEMFVPGVEPGLRYKYELLGDDRQLRLKADPAAQRAELPPGTASVVPAATGHAWGDEEWLARRDATAWHRAPLSVYEVHLGSWRRVPEEGDRSLTYRELAEVLPEYVAELGFTHVEVMPLAEHPFGGSWGYQVTSYFAPTGRHGDPDGLRELVDALHRRGIGVILDWVPAHFPRDDWALARFDGTALYEHADPRQGSHPEWGTLVFNFGRTEVRNFLIASALYWLGEFHVDGLRVDAVASMLYLDYSRRPGEWVPNRYGGRENLEAVSFLKELNEAVYAEQPGAVMVAEESTAWPGVSRPTYLGGLGFGFKWNMGWMHDTLDYFAKDPLYRRHHHNELTFGLVYAYSENFVLPLSHDEVVHGKGSLLAKMPGDHWQQLANLRSLLGWMWAHPGKQVVFMGAELAQGREWSHDRSLDWHLLEDRGHLGVQSLVRDLNRAYLGLPALWETDAEATGFAWIDASDVDANVLAFLRLPGTREEATAPRLVCVANLSPVPRSGYRIGVPAGGVWREALNTDALGYGGSGVGNGGTVWAVERAWHGHPFSVEVTLPPLAVVWLVEG